jgi:type I restriction enzyme S subunit
MSFEWPLISISEIAGDWKGSMAVGPFGSRMKADLYVPSGVRVIRGNNLSGGREPEGDYVHVSEKTADSLASCCLKPGDLVFPHRGNIGEVGITPDDGLRYMLSTSLMKLSPDRTKAEPLYLMYFFKSAVGRAALLMNASQVGTPGIATPLKSLRGIQLPLPPLLVQRQIADTLSKLDDRIALLRETNATFEAIAQALFKSWFVDFDPVLAKMEGRAPEGMDEATAALFPDALEESELGLVPRGWRVVPIGNAVEAVGGATPDTKNPAYWEPAIHCWTTPKDLSGIAAPVLLDTERKLSDQGLAKIGSGALPIGTLLLSSRAPIGYLALAQVPLAINQGYIAMPPGGLLPPLYMLFWCIQNMENIKGRANGSTFMEISKKAFRPIPALVPSPEIVEEFSAVAGTLFDRLIENERQAQNLATLRDTLLPRLISGQLRLPEAAAVVEDALA